MGFSGKCLPFLALAQLRQTQLGLSDVSCCSYSAYEVVLDQPKDVALSNLTAALDYLAQRLPPKPSVPGPRVFMGDM